MNHIASPTLFDIQHTRDRQIESWNRFSGGDKQLNAVIIALRSHRAGLTSRQLSKITGIDRTSITRTLKTNEKEFNTEGETVCGETGRRVTLYRLK